MELSIVIPAYNEEERIGGTLAKIYSFLKTKNYDYEVIVVDDGSADKTIQEAQRSRLFKENNLRVIKNRINTGKGFSVKEVIDVAQDVTGKEIPVVMGVRRPGDPPRLIGDAERIRKELNWQPQYAELDKIIKTAWDWHIRQYDLLF